MTDFNANLNEVLRYSLAPADVTLAMAKACDEGGPYDPSNVADQVLADHLAEHNDPREHIIRQDLKHRTNDQYWQSMERLRTELLGAKDESLVGEDDNYDLPDRTTLRVRHLRSPSTGRTVHKLVWRIPLSEDHPSVGPHVEYDSYNTPEETQHILTSLGLEGPKG